MEQGGLLSRCIPRATPFLSKAVPRGAQSFRPAAEVRTVQERATVESEPSRRCILQTGILLAGLALSPRTAEAITGGEGRRGLDRYIKKKKLDPLESYVPAVVAARKQLNRAGEIMRDDLEGARDLLRAGAFEGLRDNIKAIGEYAEQGGTKDAKKLVDGFFLAVQGFDYTLFQAKRNETPVKEDSDKALAKTIEALDKLLATVPADILDLAEKIVQVVEESYNTPPPQLQNAPETSTEQKTDELIQLVP